MAKAKSTIIVFKLERVVIENVKQDGKIKEVRVPTWFSMEYDTKTGKSWFVGKKMTPYDISEEMIKALTTK